jgi:pimeloyl-ACP methyl ester carboxylesterase
VRASESSALIDEGSGPPLVVFHGWNGSNHNVARWLPALTPRFRVIVPDLPGCNGVAPLAVEHTAAAYAQWAERFMDERAIPSARVGGLCSGTTIALALALRSPARVDGLLLHTPFLRPWYVRPAIRLQLRLLSSPAGVLFGPLRRMTLLATLHRTLFANAAEVEAPQLAHDQADLLRADVRAGRELARDLLRNDYYNTLRGWKKPIAVLLAEEDAFIDAHATAADVRASAPHARIEVIAGGHGWTPAFVAAQHDALERLVPALLS